MSLSAGTGSPNWFQCWRCRRAKGVHRYGGPSWSYHSHRGRPNRVVLTGRTKQRQHSRGLRNGTTLYQYECQDCGYVGYSSHYELERRAQRKEHSSLPSCCDSCEHRDIILHDPPCNPEKGDGERACADWIKAKEKSNG